MIDFTEIGQVIDDIVAMRVKAERQSGAPRGLFTQMGVKPRPVKFEYPDYYPGYRIAAEWLQQIRPHAEKGFFPEWLFEHNSPHMTEAEKVYVRENFRQYTLEVFKDLVDTMARAYHDGNYSIEWPVEDDQYVQAGLTAREFFTTGIKTYNSIEKYVFEYQAPLKIMDAMGVNVVLPGEINVVVSEDGNQVVDPGSLLTPYPEFFHTTKVVYFDENVIIIESLEKSKVDFNGKTVEEGLVYWIIDKTSWYQARQKGKKIDYEFDYVLIFDHELGYIPAKRAGGQAVQIDSIPMQQSPFLYAVDTLDKILIDDSLLSGSMATCCYPYRIMIGDPCENTMKVDGETMTCADGYFRFHDGHTIQCDHCFGTGLKDRVTPTGIMLVKAKTSTGDGDAINPSDAMFYASPSTETLDFCAKRIDYNFVKAYNLIHLKRDNSNIQGGPEVTATEIADENKALVASVTTNCRQNFETLRFLIDTMGLIRYGENFKKPAIKEPISYDYYSPEEYMKQISDVIASGQPAIITQSVIRDAATRIFFKDNESRKVFDLILRADRLMSMTQDEINIKQSKRLIDSWEVVLHDSAMMFIEEILEEDRQFFDKKISEQKQILVDKAKEFVAGIQPLQGGVIQNAQSRLNDLLKTA